MKFKTYLSVNSKRMAILALTSVLALESISSSASAMQNQYPAVEQEAINMENTWLVCNCDTNSWYDNNKDDTEFIISKPEQLAGLALLVNGGINFKDKIIKLNKNLNMSEHIWTPIGTYGAQFVGTFDGNNKTISNLTTKQTMPNQGLFGYNSGIIRNIGIIDSDIKGTFNVGGIAGKIDGNAKIENSYNKGNVEGLRCVGGIAGMIDDNAKIENSYNKGNVTGKGFVGGVAGMLDSDARIENSHNKGNVRGNKCVGGVVGYNINEGKVTKSYNRGDILGQEYVGGVVGSNRRIIENSYNIGNVEGLRCVGGVAGKIDCDAKIENSYNIGKVNGNNRFGGIVGYHINEGKIINSYNISDVLNNKHIGGVDDPNRVIIENSYNEDHATGKSCVGGVTGKIGGNSKIENSYNKGNVNNNRCFGGILVYNNGIIDCKEFFNKKIYNTIGSRMIKHTMKKEEFAKILGASFTYSKYINNGFPILKFCEKDLSQEKLIKDRTMYIMKTKKINAVKGLLDIKNSKLLKLKVLFNENCNQIISSLEINDKEIE